MTPKPPLKAWALLITLSLIWGSSFILIKKGLVGLNSLEVGSLRILSASLFLLPFAFGHLRKVKRNQVKYLVSVGFVGSFIPAFLFAIAQTRLESSITGVLNAMTPIFTILVGLAIFRQKQTSRVFIGVFIGFMGAVFLITAGSGGKLAEFNYYALFVVLATLMYAFNINIIKHRLQNLRSMAITSMSLAFVGPLALGYLVFFSGYTEKLLHVSGTLQATSYILVLGVLGTAIALIIFNKLVNITDAIFTSSVTYIIPIVAVFWGLLDGEVLLWSHLIGIVAILAGVYITNSTRKRI